MSFANDDEEKPSVRRVPQSGVHVAIKLETSSEHALWSDLTLDVARGGVFVATFHHLAIGTTVYLLLTLEGDAIPIAATGVVRWTRPHQEGSDGVAGVGIRFTELEPEDATRLARFAAEVREPMMYEADDRAPKTPTLPPRVNVASSG